MSGIARRLLTRSAVVIGLAASAACASSADAPTTSGTAATTVPSSPATTVAATGGTAPELTAVCPSYGREERGTLPSELPELSGWAFSHRHPDVLWAHNDSGEGARLLGVSAVDGALVADVNLAGVEATDWEDIATYVDPEGTPWIVVADTGDNAEQRDGVQLVLVAEPSLDVTTVDGASVVDVEWPGGAHDVEAMLVDPPTGEVVFVGKRFVDAESSTVESSAAEVSVDVVSWASLVSSPAVTAEQAGTFPVPGFQPYGPTAAAADPTGSSFALTFYGALTQVWHRAPGDGVVATILGTEPCSVATGLGQYEALAIAGDGTLYLATEGTGVPLEAFAPTAG